METFDIFSWPLVEENVLPYVFNQAMNGPSDCCAMVSTLQCCSAMYSIETDKVPPALSVEELINYVPIHYKDEIPSLDERGTASAFASTSLSYIQNFGIGLAEDMPFLGYPNNAKITPNRPRLYIDHYVALNCGAPEQNVKHEHFRHVPQGGGEEVSNLIAKHPIIGEFFNFRSFVQTRRGVYSHKKLTTDDKEQKKKKGGKPFGHCVMIVGYGRNEDGEEYYWVQNTYGPEWGVYGGYVKIVRTSFFNYYYPVNPRFR